MPLRQPQPIQCPLLGRRQTSPDLQIDQYDFFVFMIDNYHVPWLCKLINVILIFIFLTNYDHQPCRGAVVQIDQHDFYDQ